MGCAACAEARRKLLEAALSRDLTKVSRAAMEGIRELAAKVLADQEKTKEDGGRP